MTEDHRYTIIEGDCIKGMATLPDGCVHTCVTSPPYWGLRDYGHDDQIGAEKTPEAYVENMVEVFREVRRILRDDGTVWLNLGDSYARNGGGVESRMNSIDKMGVGQKATYLAGAMQTVNKVPFGLKSKDLVGIPWRVAFALQADGWYLRQDIIWHKPNPMPEAVTDRCTKAHEYIFLLSKSQKYYYDSDAIKEPLADASHGRADRKRRLIERTGMGTLGKQVECGVEQSHGYAGLALGRNGKTGYSDDGKRNKRSVWTITTKPFRGAHFATFPPDLIEPCVLAGCPEGGTVLDPFTGSGTTCVVALNHNRRFVGTELNPDYIKIATNRIADEAPMSLMDVME